MGAPISLTHARGLGHRRASCTRTLIDNLGEVIWYGAQGLMIEPEYTDKWGAEVLLISEWADTHWQHVKFPEEFADNVKLRNFCVIDGETFVIPQNAGAPEIGAVVATGPTAAAAIKECKRIAEMVDGYSIEKPIEALDEAKESLTRLLVTTPTSPFRKSRPRPRKRCAPGRYRRSSLTKSRPVKVGLRSFEPCRDRQIQPRHLRGINTSSRTSGRTDRGRITSWPTRRGTSTTHKIAKNKKFMEAIKAHMEEEAEEKHESVRQMDMLAKSGRVSSAQLEKMKSRSHG